MEVLKKKILRLLNAFPGLKSNLKIAYQYTSYLIFKRRYKEIIHSEIIRYSDDHNETFFGYYDKLPINESNSYLLYHSTNYPSYKAPTDTKPINVVLYDFLNKKQVMRHETTAWNWQQGARLQWLTDDLYAFNDFDTQSQNYVMKVFSTVTNEEEKRFNKPIQDGYKDEYFLSINYNRLFTLIPDYGYRNLPILNDSELDKLDEDGIWYVDVKTGQTKLLISLESIAKFKPQKIFEKSKHYLNHVMISPSGQNFIFLHRYVKNNIRYDRLIFSDLKGNLNLLNDNEMISHCCWCGDEKVFGYMRGENNKDGYFTIDLTNGDITQYSNNELQNLGDGHPDIKGSKFVTDTYPNKFLAQRLIYGNLEECEHKIIGSLKSSLKYTGESRCDLHPRLSHDGGKVFFDTVHYGKREFCMMNLDDLNI